MCLHLWPPSQKMDMTSITLSRMVLFGQNLARIIMADHMSHAYDASASHDLHHHYMPTVMQM